MSAPAIDGPAGADLTTAVARPRALGADPARLQAVALWLLGADLALWGFVAAWEDNLAILAMHLLVLGMALPVVLVVAREALLLSAVALALRSAFTALGWYTAYDAERRFYIGTNSDASRFWDAALLNFQQASLAFEDPLFPRLNVLVTQWSDTIGQAAYLATTQTVLMAGTLMVVFAYVFVRHNHGERVARWTALLLAVSPTAITFSSGLMRDALIGMFGFALLAAVSSLKRRPPRRAGPGLAAVQPGLPAGAGLPAVHLAGGLLHRQPGAPAVGHAAPARPAAGTHQADGDRGAGRHAGLRDAGPV